MINGYAINSIMSYYKFDVYEMIGMIQITVRTIHNCDCDIYVSKSNLSSYLDYPTTDQYTYKFTSDTLEIENQNNIGQYMIGVIGQDCIFEVLLHLGGFQMHYIHNGQYIDTMIENKVQYYYMNNHQQSFRILISNMKNLLFQIHVLDENETFQLVNNEDLFGGVIQINKDICESCTYILNITPIRFTVLSILLTYNNIPQPMQYGRIYYDYCQETCEFNLQPGELSLFLYSKSVQLTFHSKFELINKMDLSYSNHIIPINESCLLRICNNSYYSIHLNNRDNPTILQLGKLFEGRNTIEKNKMKFNFKVINVKLDYEIQVQGKSDIIIDVYDSNSNKVMPKSSYELNKQIKRLIYQFDNIQKPYQIILFCNDDYHIMVNTYNQNHIKYINFNNHYIEIIEESQHYNVQHILDQDLQYEILDCLGRSEMQQTSLGQSKDVFFRLQSKDRTQPYPFNIVSFVPHQQYSHDKWYIKNTKLQGIQFLNDQIEITINTMRRKKTGSLKLNKLIYKLHLSDQQNIMKALGCEIDIGFLQNYTDRPIFYNYTILEVKEKDVSIQFTVLRNRELIYGLLVFQAYYENYNIPYTYFYEVTQIYNEKEQQPKRKMDKENEDLKLDYILIVIFISLIFSMVLVSQCVCKSHQKEKRRQLNEEQQQLKEQELFKLHQ